MNLGSDVSLVGLYLLFNIDTSSRVMKAVFVMVGGYNTLFGFRYRYVNVERML